MDDTSSLFKTTKFTIIRYQRELVHISDIGSQKDSASPRKHKLPLIDHISSALNHFLMLDKNGDMWAMGITKLGQRTSSRNSGRYLNPRLVSVINRGRRRRQNKRMRFKKIACGVHHNVAISNDGDLYSWGQNMWLQCGHNKKDSGYND
eukprot:329975_1